MTGTISEGGEGTARAASASVPGRLSDQLRAYYRKHLDPESSPEPEDLDALHAIENAEAGFNQRLEKAFQKALAQVRQLGYPGVSDPEVAVLTRIRPIDGLDHEAAVQYRVGGGDVGPPLVLPGSYNGLGYQNLISMVFRLMAFRDSWMRVGKAAREEDDEQSQIEPIHMVLVEEPASVPGFKKLGSLVQRPTSQVLGAWH